MAKEAEIEMSACRLLEENGCVHFMTERFDREGSCASHHMQTLCTTYHLDYKKKGVSSYEQLCAAIQRPSLLYEQLK